jgi:hypothetical protein
MMQFGMICCAPLKLWTGGLVNWMQEPIECIQNHHSVRQPRPSQQSHERVHPDVP